MNETVGSERKISAMLLPELKQRAAQLGIKMPPKSRKADYIAAIQEKLAGGAQSASADMNTTSAESADVKAKVNTQEREAAENRVRRTRKAPVQQENSDLVAKAAAAENDAVAANAQDAANDSAHNHPRTRLNRKQNETKVAHDEESAAAEQEQQSQREVRSRGKNVELTPEEKQAALDALGDAAERRADYRRNHENNDGESEHDGNRAHNRRERNERNNRRDRRERNVRRDRRGRNNGNSGNNDRRNLHHQDENVQREEQYNNDAQNLNEEVLIPVAGILDTAGTNSYLRTGGYLPGKSDAYVSQQTIKKYGLRRGDAVVGAVRSVTDSPARRGQRQHKYNPLVEVTSINGLSPEDSLQRPEFNKLTPLYPQETLRMETTKNALTTRVIDLVAPIGKGQRGLIVSPPKAGKTMVMQQMAVAIAKNNPNVHLMVVLVDERPEEVTDMQRLVQGEVIASTFDRPASDHTIVAELAVERAKRLVELGQDVVILLDSLTRLSRAYNLATPASGRILSGGVDAAALYPPKKFFGAARNIENGGSLTIIASALVETGSKMDEVIFEEFKGTGNMELRLSRQLADRRIFPAVDVNASGTRREEQLFSPEELKIVWHLRRALGTLDVQEASDYLLNRLRKTESNKEFLVSIVRGMQGSGE